jgi:hypothetical protein
MPVRPLPIFSLVIVWLGLNSVAHANGFCGSMTPEQSAKLVDVVFAGKVIAANQEAWRINRISFERHPPFIHLTEDSDRYQTTFEVTTVWKGSVTARTYVLHTLLTADDSYSFRHRQDYIVYARWVEGELRTSQCYRNNPLSAAKDDLLAFGSGKPPIPNPSSIPGIVQKLIFVFLLLLMLGWLAWKAWRKYSSKSHEQTNPIS